MSKSNGRKGCVLSLFFAGYLGLSSSFSAYAQTTPVPPWFRYGKSVQTRWTVTGNPADDHRVMLRQLSSDALGKKHRVLFLYPRASSAYDTAITTMLGVFDAKDLDVEITAINFENNDERGREALRFAESVKSDLIVAMGSESTAWLFDHYRGGAIPVVSVCSKDPVQLGQAQSYTEGSGSNFAFTSLNVPVEVQMAYVRELKPDLKNLAVLVDAKNVSAVQTQAEPIAKFARERGVQIIWGAVQNPSKAREELGPIVADAVRTMRKSDPDLSKSLFWVTGSTSVFLEIKTINDNADRVPVISVVPEVVKDGADTAVMSIGVSFESNAHLAAIYVSDILGGKARAGELKVGLVSPPDIAVSFLKAREIGMKVPFTFFETASFVYDYDGRPVRSASADKSKDN